MVLCILLTLFGEMTVSNFDELLDFKYLIYQAPDVWRVDNTIHWCEVYMK